jgi:hypothetical protein
VDLKTAGEPLNRVVSSDTSSSRHTPGVPVHGRFEAPPRHARTASAPRAARGPPGDLSWTARLIREVSVAIETEHFFPNPSWRCTECEFFAHCQAWRGWERVNPPEITAASTSVS